jgi:hypothetical protein
MILKLNKPIPKYVEDALNEVNYINQGNKRHLRECTMFIPQEDAITYMDPESFSLSDVFGKCEFAQAIVAGREMPVVIKSFEKAINHRSFEREAAVQVQEQLLAALKSGLLT